MKIVFFLYHAGYVRNFKSVLRALASQGCTIQLYVDVVRRPWELTLAQNLVAEYPDRISLARASFHRAPTSWMRLATMVRGSIDYLRYLHPEYRDATGLRLRAEQRVPRAMVRLGARLRNRSLASVRRAIAALQALEDIIPTIPEIDRVLAREAPDLVVVTPLVDFASEQVDYIKSARRLGVRTAAWVASWDNLTNKGLLRVQPDRLFVWNEAQRREAVTFHDMPAERVVVTGAQIFDHWFGRQPRRSREEFCAHVGLDPSRDFILYLGSSRQIAPDEVGFAGTWVRLLRNAPSAALSDIQILFRPHPGRYAEWQPVHSARLPRVVVWPHDSATTAFDSGFDDDYFESMYYARAVVGVNTSGMIESAILGKPVHTWRTPEFTGGQEETLHFRHLLDVNGGLLHVASSAQEHLRMLEESVTAASEPDARSQRFIEAFVRPYGLDQPATPRFVAAVTRLAAEPAPRPVPVGLPSRLCRPALRALAPVILASTGDRPAGEAIGRRATAVGAWTAAIGHRVMDLCGREGRRGLARWRRRSTRGTREAAKGARKALRRAARAGQKGRKIVRRSGRRLVYGAAGLARRLTGA